MLSFFKDCLLQLLQYVFLEGGDDKLSRYLSSGHHSTRIEKYSAAQGEERDLLLFV